MGEVEAGLFEKIEVSFCKEDKKGFGIYFEKGIGEAVLVEGFVRGENDSKGPAELLGTIKAKDVLTAINDENIETYDFMDVVEILRSSPSGLNTLSFKRPKQVNTSPEQLEDSPTKKSFFHNLRKVKFSLKRENGHEFTKGSGITTPNDDTTENQDAELRSSCSDIDSVEVDREEFEDSPSKNCGKSRNQGWPQAFSTCDDVHYTPCHQKFPLVNTNVLIEPENSLQIVVKSMAMKFGWKYSEILHVYHRFQELGIHTNEDLLRSLRGHCFGKIVQTSKFPRFGKDVVGFLYYAAMEMCQTVD